MTEAWTSLLAKFSQSPGMLFTLGMWVVHGLCGVVPALVLTELQRRNRWVGYRIHPEAVAPPEVMRRGIRDLLVSHFLLFPVSFWLVYHLLAWRGLRMDSALPSPLEVLGYLVAYMLADETSFYWVHRLMHRPWFFHHIHRHHHQFRYTAGVAFEYFHPVESTALIFTMLSGPLLLGGHVVTVWLWMGVRFLETVDAHSGYRFPWSLASERHAFHHHANRGWYGSFFNLWDRALGTTQGLARAPRGGRGSVAP